MLGQEKKENKFSTAVRNPRSVDRRQIDTLSADPWFVETNLHI